MLQEQCNQIEDEATPDTAVLDALAAGAERAHAARVAADKAALDAERAYVSAAWAECQRGTIDWADLLAVWESVQGWGAPGFSKRWAEDVPFNHHQIRRAIAGRLPEPRRWDDPTEYGLQTWRIARGVRGSGYPPKGTDVVYRLYDAEDQLLYIGCSGNLRNRIGGHAAKPWTYLTARDTRGYAPGLEAVAIFTERPPLNEKQLHAWGGALQLSAAASRARLLTPDMAKLARRLHAEVEARLDAEEGAEDLAALFADEAGK